MPYSIMHKGDKYCLVRKEKGSKGEPAGSIKSCHDSMVMAKSAMAAIMASEHGWKPTGKKRRTYKKITKRYE